MFKPFRMIFIFLPVMSLACQFVAGGFGLEPTSQPEILSTTIDTPAPALSPTSIPTKVDPPATVPAAVPQEFFTEEFESEDFFGTWFYFITGPNSDQEDELSMEQEGDGVTIDLGALDMYMYYIYEPKVYSDVKITMTAENLGRNNNNVSMICRLDFENATWYEFSVESGGVWYLYAFDNGYNFLDSGGASVLKQGKEMNEYALECNGEMITMYINGQKLKSYPDRVYSFREGNVGFNISSLNVLPITVSVKSFEISQP